MDKCKNGNCPFGNDATDELHPCPYAEDINDNHDDVCDCCSECEGQCADDI